MYQDCSKQQDLICSAETRKIDSALVSAVKLNISSEELQQLTQRREALQREFPYSVMARFVRDLDTIRRWTESDVPMKLLEQPSVIPYINNAVVAYNLMLTSLNKKSEQSEEVCHKWNRKSFVLNMFLECTEYFANHAFVLEDDVDLALMIRAKNMDDALLNIAQSIEHAICHAADFGSQSAKQWHFVTETRNQTDHGHDSLSVAAPHKLNIELSAAVQKLNNDISELRLLVESRLSICDTQLQKTVQQINKFGEGVRRELEIMSDNLYDRNEENKQLLKRHGQMLREKTENITQFCSKEIQTLSDSFSLQLHTNVENIIDLVDQRQIHSTTSNHQNKIQNEWMPTSQSDTGMYCYSSNIVYSGPDQSVHSDVVQKFLNCSGDSTILVSENEHDSVAKLQADDDGNDLFNNHLDCNN
jgi:hypothetical protein